MANEIEKGNFGKPTDVMSDIVGGALIEKAIVAPLVYSEDVPGVTDKKKFVKQGTVDAADLAESASHSYGAGDEYTETEVTVTAAKTTAVSKVTAEAIRFGGGAIDKVLTAQGAGIARAIDDKIIALFDGFSNQVSSGSGSTLQAEDLLDGVQTVHGNLAGDEAQLVAVVSYKGANDLKKELIGSSAAVFGQESQTSLLQGPFENMAGFVGSLPGVDVYATTGLPTATADDVGAVFNPNKAFAMMADPSVNVWEVPVGSGGVWVELISYLFNGVSEWYDEAGVEVLYAT